MQMSAHLLPSLSPNKLLPQAHLLRQFIIKLYIAFQAQVSLLLHRQLES
ncbi:hypothetical protein GCM10020331_026430 [Ectobacillus funiculus]